MYWDAFSANIRTTLLPSIKTSSLAIMHLKMFEHLQTIRTMQCGSQVLWFCNHLWQGISFCFLVFSNAIQLPFPCFIIASFSHFMAALKVLSSFFASHRIDLIRVQSKVFRKSKSSYTKIGIPACVRNVTLTENFEWVLGGWFFI